MQLNEKIKTGLIFAAIAVFILIIDVYFIWLAIYFLAGIVGYYEACKLFKAEENLIWLLAGLVFASTTQMPVMSMLFAIMAYAGYLAYTQGKLANLLPLFYAGLGVSFIFEVYVKHEVLGLLWLLLSVVSCDSFAYFVGKKYGKTKFCQTSPNKTLEGVLGGVLIGGFISFIYAVFVFNELSVLAVLFLSFAMAFFAVFGDLFESYLKRLADVKDSGNLFPGHGGVLDRIDALIFSSVLMVLFV